ncbi:tetratricopeptide repeat protein [Aquimarina sp. 2201CG5-10]|uniref:tetratricopeptide repeat protein n=1 Tax=Aquimarina callyspongiae TaxID=3098150 RepID=UPI002AB4ECDA|nr:tetratricopeptide repeat protein [Aquimarina sp. 2201CG5-10]MDY8134627.1 tetratricopeptide repeat protein [Aquimarina sp. 2201CG5-10]
MKIYFISLLFIIMSYGHSQETDSTLVRLQREVELAQTDSIKINALLELAELQYDRDFSSSGELVNQALKLIHSGNENQNQQQLAKAYVIKGVINRRKGDYPKALDYYFKAKEIYETEKDIWHVSDVYHNMGMMYRYQNAHDKAIALYKKSIEIKEPLKDIHGIAAGYNMMGVSYRQSKQLDSAMICYNKAKSLFISIDSTDDIQRVNNNLGALYRESGNIEEALRLGYENIKYAKRYAKAYSLCAAYYNISNIYKKTKEYDKSLIYADSSLSIAVQENFRERITKAYLRKSYLQAQMGNHKAAYDDYRTFNRHSDSIYNIENVKKIQALELNHKFRQEKFADSLAFVQEKREVTLLAIAEKSKKWLYFALFIVSLIGAFVITLLVRRNYRSKVQIGAEKLEKEKAQKELLDQKILAKEEEIKRLVADNTMRLNFKEELLNQLKKELVEKNPQELKTSLSILTKELKSQISIESKLSTLQHKINDVNQGFDSKLIKLYPELTKTEREVCALLRLNLSIKEIMTIRNSSMDAVKSVRYRIRKKIGLTAKEELEQFIQTL